MVKTYTRSSTFRLIPALIAAAVLSTGLLQAAPQLGQGVRRGQTQTPAGGYSREEAEVIANRLYKATLGRDGDQGGLTQAITEIQRGNLQQQVNSMLASQEFRTKTARMSAAEILDGFYNGLLQRNPDSAGVGVFMNRVERRQYAPVLMEMLASPEFRTSLQKEAGTSSNPTRPNNNVSRVDAALDCQVRALDAVRRDVRGNVFLSFDRLPDTSQDGRVVSGPAVDRFDGDRDLTYRCDGNDVSYTYADRRPAKGADQRLEFPSGAVRACMAAQNEVRSFEAASLSAGDSKTEYILGIGTKSNGNGIGRVTCDMDGTRVLGVRAR
jgi:hypothetical protein